MDLDDKSLKSIRYMMGMNILTKFLILIKGILLEENFLGVSQFNIYELAFGHIMLLSSILADGFVLSTISIYRKIEEEKGREYVFHHLNNLLSIVFTIGNILSMFFIIIYSIKNDFNINQEYLKFISLGIFMITLSILRVIFTGYLQMMHGFLAGPRGNVVRGFLYVLYLLLVGDNLGLEGLMIFGNIILLIQVIIAYFGTKAHKGYEFKFIIDFKDEYLKDTFLGILYMIFIIYIYKLSVDEKHDNRFIGLFIGTLISSVIAVVYPLLCEGYYKSKYEGSFDKFNKIFVETIGFVLKIVTPIIIIGFIGSDIINHLFIDGLNIDMNFFISHGIGLLSISLLPLLFRTMISYGDLKTPAILVSISYLIASLIRRNSIGFISYIIYDIVLFLVLLISIILINKKTKFLLRDDIKIYLNSTINSGIFVFIILYLLDFILVRFLQDSINNMTIFYLIASTIIVLYLVYYEKKSEKIKNKKS